MRRLGSVALALVLAAGCAGGPPGPSTFDPAIDTCGHCGMPVRNVLFAAQLAAPGTATLFFDDINCLVEYINRNPRFAPGAIAYVVDHHTAAWIPAATALYTRNLQIATPMGSHLIAHGSPATQQADPAAASGARATAKDLVPLDMPDGTR